jgi:hypothetical protein
MRSGTRRGAAEIFVREIDQGDGTEMQRRGRPPLFDRALTAAERRERYRAKRDAALAAQPDPNPHMGEAPVMPDEWGCTLDQVMAAAPEFAREMKAEIAKAEAALEAGEDQSAVDD